MALDTRDPLVSTFERKVISVIEVRGGIEQLLAVAGRAVTSQPVRVAVLVARATVLIESEKGSAARKGRELRQRERHLDLVEVAGLAEEVVVPADEVEIYMRVTKRAEHLRAPR